jgi:hypothetical protein
MQVGAWVSLLDEPHSGKVLAIQGAKALVQWDDSGFEEWVNMALLVERNMDWNPNSPIVPKDKSPIMIPSTPAVPSLQVIDLHAKALREEGILFSKESALETQLQVARDALSKAQQAGLNQVDLIHGVGEGILKSKLHQWLKHMGYTYYDAPWKLYGEGATRVELRRKGKLL